MLRFTRTALFTSALAFAVVACGDDPVAPPEPTTLSIVSGNGQSLDPGQTSAALTVRVVDQDAAPMEGVTVAFTGSGVEHTLSALSATTGATGEASVTVTAGATAGSFDVEASVSGIDPVTFELDVNAPRASTMTLVSGDAQDLDYKEVSAALVVEVRDQSNAPLQGVTVTFTGSGVAHSVSAGTATTGANGRAQITVTAGVVPGEIEISASVASVTPVTFGLTVLDAPFSVTAPAVGVTGLTFDGTWLWAVGDPAANPIIYRIDPMDGSVEQSFNAPAGAGLHRGLAWDGQNLWYVSQTTQTIYQINPSNGSVVKSFATPGSEPRGLTWVAGFLWHNDYTGSVGTVYKIDPADGSVDAQFASPVTHPVGLTWDGTHFWTSQSAANVADRTLVRFTNAGVIDRQLPNPGTLQIGLAYDSTGPWLWSSDPDEGVIHRVDPTP